MQIPVEMLTQVIIPEQVMRTQVEMQAQVIQAQVIQAQVIQAQVIQAEMPEQVIIQPVRAAMLPVQDVTIQHQRILQEILPVTPTEIISGILMI
jgi:hypothetical protein